MCEGKARATDDRFKNNPGRARWRPGEMKERANGGGDDDRERENRRSPPFLHRPASVLRFPSPPS